MATPYILDKLLDLSTNKLDATANAVSATKLATARTIATNLASTTAASFNGTANVTPGVSGVLPAANGGTGNAAGLAAAASKLNVSQTIDGVGFDGTAAVTHYGTCSTDAATVAKVVACSNFSLVTGAKIAVKFSNTNTAASPTLNVNATGDKAIYYRGAAITAGYLAANRSYEFIYNGTQYELVGDLNTDVSVSQAISTTNSEYPLLASAIAALSTTTIASACFNSGITINPSTGTITATTFNGNATTAVTPSSTSDATTKVATTQWVQNVLATKNFVVFGPTAPADTTVLWINTTDSTANYYDSTAAAWVTLTARYSDYTA